MASQDSWARPLAKTLVDLFRVNSCTFIRRQQVYDPQVGAPVITETTFPGIVAVQEMTHPEEGGVAGDVGLVGWIALEDVGDIWPTTLDQVEYEGDRWKIGASLPNSSNNVLYAGDQKYAVKILCKRIG